MAWPNIFKWINKSNMGMMVHDFPAKNYTSNQIGYKNHNTKKQPIRAQTLTTEHSVQTGF